MNMYVEKSNMNEIWFNVKPYIGHILALASSLNFK